VFCENFNGLECMNPCEFGNGILTVKGIVRIQRRQAQERSIYHRQ
jgi:hypothetical protein